MSPSPDILKCCFSVSSFNKYACIVPGLSLGTRYSLGKGILRFFLKIIVASNMAEKKEIVSGFTFRS